MGTLRLLEAMRELDNRCKFYQASSSEMFGSSPPPQNEHTAFQPRSPYACAKVFAHQLCQNYRDAYGLFISCGILFNHESPRRGIPFVTRKITRTAARIKHGLDKKIFLGNLDAKRDWGFAGDYVEAMWLMLQQEKPDDYVIATGESYSVRDCLDVAFGTLGLDWKNYVELDPRYLRPTEVDHLRGDASKAREKLGWKPKVTFKQLIEQMVRADEEDVRSALAGRPPQM
jgi:GDPmannose 4,6-dehydratase